MKKEKCRFSHRERGENGALAQIVAIFVVNAADDPQSSFWRLPFRSVKGGESTPERTVAVVGVGLSDDLLIAPPFECELVELIDTHLENPVLVIKVVKFLRESSAMATPVMVTSIIHHIDLIDHLEIGQKEEKILLKCDGLIKTEMALFYDLSIVEFCGRKPMCKELKL